MAREAATGTSREVYRRRRTADDRERHVCEVADALMRASMQCSGFASARQLAEAAVDAMEAGP